MNKFKVCYVCKKILSYHVLQISYAKFMVEYYHNNFLITKVFYNMTAFVEEWKIQTFKYEEN